MSTSDAASKGSTASNEPTDPPFGCRTPYAEPLWYSRNVSPHYNESHRKLRREVRRYLDEELLPYAFEWESAGQVPDKARDVIPAFESEFLTRI